MSEEHNPESPFPPAPEGVSESDWLAACRAQIESQERIHLAHAKAKEVQAEADDQQRRMFALTCALSSYGLGHQALNPSPAKIEGDAITKRAGDFDRFIRGDVKADVVHLTDVSKAQ